MIITCSHCATRLQIEDAKIPAHPFTVRCPKCQSAINGQPAVGASESAGTNDRGAFAIGDAPALDNVRLKSSSLTPAPAVKLDSSPEGAGGSVRGYGNSSSGDAGELVRLLMELLQRGASAIERPRDGARLGWGRRRALVCSAPAHREALARLLTGSDYHVFVAEDTTWAIEYMREESMDVVVLDQDFDPAEQGAAFIKREINALLPVDRRRLFLVHMSASTRTLDALAAFTNNVNLVINPVDIENLPSALERSMQDFNDLYRDFNNAQGAGAR